MNNSATGSTPFGSAGERPGFALPLFVTRENKYICGFIMFALAAALYLLSNHYHLFEPQMLPMTWIDLTTPFIPNTVLLYASESLLFALVYIHCRNLANANKYLYSFLALQMASVVIFWLWPTTYPRDRFPLPEDMNAVSYFVFNWIRGADTPASCCPSLHVSGCFLSAFIYLDEQRKKFPVFFLWAAAVAFSTLTTKQHYFIDVVTGFLMAVIFYWIFHRLVPYRPLQENR